MRETRSRAGTYLWLGLLGILFLAPLAWMVSTSLKSPDEMANPDLNLLPREPTLESYEKILGQTQTPVFQWFINSLLAATLQTVLILATASMAAYALARMQFPGRRFMTALVLVTLFVPPISLVIPNYVIVAEIGWLDSLTAVVVPGAAGAFGVFFLRQFFLSLPKELEEAAIIDGAGKFRVFWQVILPLSKPALATLALLSFLTNWNDFLWPLYVLFSPENLTLQPGLSTLQSAYQTDYAAMMAGGVIASVPVLLLFVATQRFVVEGVSRSGLKG
jgi:multiple sugar transport system permease protein